MLVSQRSLRHTLAQLLDARMADMQDLRDDYHVRESDYEVLELTMDREERELSNLETRFFNLLAAGTRARARRRRRRRAVRATRHLG